MNSNLAFSYSYFDSSLPFISLTVVVSDGAAYKKHDWTARTDEVIGGFPCLKHKVTKETALFGKHGEIFEIGNGLYKARIWNTRVAHGLIESGTRYQRGDEALVIIPEGHLARFVKALKVHKDRGRQLKYTSFIEKPGR